MTVRDIRLRWPEAERALGRVGEIIVTRDSKPVARILPYEPKARGARPRFDPAEQRLEAIVQLHARVAGGLLTRPAARALAARLDTLLGQEPYELVRAPADLVERALLQVRALPKGHCPTLDRLHLGVMQALELRRLLTNDDAQARAARALGFSVVTPR